MAKTTPSSPVDVRLAVGRAARTAVPRSAHADWVPAPDRASPVDILERQAASRDPSLVPIRYGRMASSPFAFYRGAAAVMAADLAGTPVSGIRTQVCGDAHLMNFGAFAAPDRRLMFDLNDFDETLPGPWEWDVKRLAASLVIACRDRADKPADTRRVVMGALAGYRTSLLALAERTDLDVWYSRLEVQQLLAQVPAGIERDEVKGVLQAAATRDNVRSFRRLTEMVDGQRRFVERPPLLERVTDPDTERRLQAILDAYPASLTDGHRALFSRYRLVDLARKVVGVGSVGLAAYVALYLGRDDDDPLFLQVKEAQASVLAEHLHDPDVLPDPEHGHRVVAGQELMQAATDILLGWAKGLQGRRYYVRQLSDMKWSLDLERIDVTGLALYARLCGESLARAHARSGDRLAIAGYLGSGDQFDRAVAAFAEVYADQNARDHQALVDAIGSGRITAAPG
jgi:uncharacterized protein (DUF2252 family)